MLNAVQGVDMLMGGFNSAIEEMRERSLEKAEQSAYARLLGEYNVLLAEHNRGWSLYKEVHAHCLKVQRDRDAAQESGTRVWQDYCAKSSELFDAERRVKEENAGRIAAETELADMRSRADRLRDEGARARNALRAAGLEAPF